MQHVYRFLLLIFILTSPLYAASSLVWEEESSAGGTSTTPWIVGQTYQKLLKKYPEVFKHIDQKELLDHYYFFRGLCANRIELAQRPTGCSRVDDDTPYLSDVVEPAEFIISKSGYLIPDLQNHSLSTEDKYWQAMQDVLQDNTLVHSQEKKDALAWLTTVEALVLASIANKSLNYEGPSATHDRYTGFPFADAYLFSQEPGLSTPTLATLLAEPSGKKHAAHRFFNKYSPHQKATRIHIGWWIWSPGWQIQTRSDRQMLDAEFELEKKTLRTCRAWRTLANSKPAIPPEIRAAIFRYNFSDHDLVGLWRINQMYGAGRKWLVDYEKEFKPIYEALAPKELKESRRLGMPRVSVDQWYQRTVHVPKLVSTLIADIPTATQEERQNLFDFAYHNFKKQPVYDLLQHHYFCDEIRSSRQDLRQMVAWAKLLAPAHDSLLLALPARWNSHHSIRTLNYNPFKHYTNSGFYDVAKRWRPDEGMLAAVQSLSRQKVSQREWVAFVRIMNMTTAWFSYNNYLVFSIKPQLYTEEQSTYDRSCCWQIIDHTQAALMAKYDMKKNTSDLSSPPHDWLEQYSTKLWQQASFYDYTPKGKALSAFQARYLSDGAYALLNGNDCVSSKTLMREPEGQSGCPFAALPDVHNLPIPAPEVERAEHMFSSATVVGSATALITAFAAAVLTYRIKKRKPTQSYKTRQPNRSSMTDSSALTAVAAA